MTFQKFELLHLFSLRNNEVPFYFSFESSQPQFIPVFFVFFLFGLSALSYYKLCSYMINRNALVDTRCFFDLSIESYVC